MRRPTAAILSRKVSEGKVLCLLEDDGAGKSTLSGTLFGVHQPTRGYMLMNGNPVSFSRPKNAQGMGFASVHQFGGTYALMSNRRNFSAGGEPTIGLGLFKVFDYKKGE